jgi:hypothetical protein
MPPISVIKGKSCISEYFKSTSTLCMSYKYTPTIESKLFNYKSTLQCLDIEHRLLNPRTRSWSSSPFNYQPVGHVNTGDVTIVRNKELKSLILKSPGLSHGNKILLYYELCGRLYQTVSEFRKRRT